MDTFESLDLALVFAEIAPVFNCASRKFYAAHESPNEPQSLKRFAALIESGERNSHDVSLCEQSSNADCKARVEAARSRGGLGLFQAACRS